VGDSFLREHSPGKCFGVAARQAVAHFQEITMKKTIIAAIVACSAAISFTQPAFADSLTIKINPGVPVVKKVIVRPAVKKVIVVRKPCYYKTVKKIYNRKTVITKTRVCP
jgi:hypothetical protein